jgi:hypothetical protein
MNRTESMTPQQITVIQNNYLNPLTSTVVTLGRIKVRVRRAELFSNITDIQSVSRRLRSVDFAGHLLVLIIFKFSNKKCVAEKIIGF